MHCNPNLSDKELKQQGNKCFSLHKYEEAVNCYSKAIMKNPTQAMYYTNRALANLRLKRWELSCQDCRYALDLDPLFVKGHFFLGLALQGLESYDEAIKYLQRGVDLAKEQKLNFGDDMASILRQVKKRRFQLKEEQRLREDIELQTYLNQLIIDDAQRNIELHKQSDKKQNVECSSANGESDGKKNLLQSKRFSTCSEIEAFRDNLLQKVNDLFAKVDERRRKRDIPDYLCGKISFEILQEPVITPSGITYEKKDIEEHLQRVGHFDPVTRTRLTQEQLIPNLAMKEVVDAFIQENEWALEY